MRENLQRCQIRQGLEYIVWQDAQFVITQAPASTAAEEEEKRGGGGGICQKEEKKMASTLYLQSVEIGQGIEEPGRQGRQLIQANFPARSCSTDQHYVGLDHCPRMRNVGADSQEVTYSKVKSVMVSKSPKGKLVISFIEIYLPITRRN